MRDQIENRLGSGTVEEVKRWNDLAPDPLTEFGVEISVEEAVAQEEHLARLAERSDRARQEVEAQPQATQAVQSSAS